MSRRTEDRRRQIVARAGTGPMSVDDLASEFDVTPSTIRRDLARLSAAGLLARTYGGAIAPGAHESSLGEREPQGFESKVAIADWAAQQVRPGEHLLLDGGSTVALLARRLPPLADLTVTTASLPVLTTLRAHPEIGLVSLGGRLRPLSDAFVGPLTEAALERLTVDRAFLGTDAVGADGGLCEAVPEQTRLKELMAARARHVYVLAHSAKLGRAPFHAWARLKGPWTLVTDEGVDAGFVETFSTDGRAVVVVPGQGP